MSKTILAQIEGFTPVIDSVVQDVGVTTAVVFGKVWRYCQMSDGVCKASQGRLAEDLNMSVRSVTAHIKKLVVAKYLRDTTPNLVGVPHTYADTGKAGMGITMAATSSQPMQNLHTTSAKIAEVPMQNLHTKKVLKKEKEIKQKQTITPDFSKLTDSQEYLKIPEIQRFIQATSWIPGTFVIEAIYNAMRDGLETDKLKAAFQEWTFRGYNPKNVQGYLEWAKSGIPPTRNNQTKSQTNSANVKQTASQAREILAEWVAEKEAMVDGNYI
jgi:DNA-binding Lrp family transcriptional regulator